MRIVLASIVGIVTAFAAASPSLAAPSVLSSGRAQIIAPAGITVIRQIVSQSFVTFSVIGSPGDAVALGVPGSVAVTGSSGQSLSLNTVQSQMLFANGTILSEDAVSVSVGAVFNGQVADASPDDYQGVMVVLAQYN